MTSLDRPSAHDDEDDAPIRPGPGVRWTGDGSLGRNRAPWWGSSEAAPAIDGVDAPPTVEVAAPPSVGVLRPQPTVGGMVLTTVLRRLVCWLIDRGLKTTIFFVVLLIAGVEMSPTPWAAPELVVASALLNAGYDFVFGIHGVTPAGYLLRVRIVALDGNDPGARRSLVRASAASLNEAVLFVGSLWALFDARRQAMHDKVAGTIVIMTPPPEDHRPE